MPQNARSATVNSVIYKSRRDMSEPEGRLGLGESMEPDAPCPTHRHEVFVQISQNLSSLCLSVQPEGPQLTFRGPRLTPFDEAKANPCSGNFWNLDSHWKKRSSVRLLFAARTR